MKVYETYFRLIPFALLLGLLLGCSSTAKLFSTQSKKDIISDFNTLMQKHYVEEEAAIQLAYRLDSLGRTNHFDRQTNLEDFLVAIETEAQELTKDKHLLLASLQRVKKSRSAAKNIKAKAEILQDSIGYIYLPVFINNKDVIDALVEQVLPCKSLIIDLRNSRGGHPKLVQHFSSYFFDKPTFLNTLYWREGNRYEEFWTEEIAEKRLNDVPLYILCNKKTFSASEEFIYNLVAREKAIVVGETTGGGANPGQFFKLNKTCGAFIPKGKSINPVTKSNWSEGITPDYKCAPEDALQKALEIITKGLHK